MADNINKIIYGGEILIDLTTDTVTADKLLSGFTAHDKSGAIISGTCSYDVDSQDANAAVAEILYGKTAYARGVKLTGTMPNRGSVSGDISTVNGTYTIQQGYHDGSGKVSISSAEKEKIVSENIRSGVTILGVIGSMTGTEDELAEDNKNVTPSKSEQIITPSSGYTCFRQVTVAAIPYSEQTNSAGGLTVTIG